MDSNGVYELGVEVYSLEATVCRRHNPEDDYAEYQTIETYLETHGATIVNRYLLGEDLYPWAMD